MTSLNQSDTLLQCLRECMGLCFIHGTRSAKIVDHLHTHIKHAIEQSLDPTTHRVKLEVLIPSINASGHKRCDIVVESFAEDTWTPRVVCPVKFIRGNYSQNKNNGWENMTGEVMQLHWANPTLQIIPINIIFNSIPYKSGGRIKKFESITYDKSYKIYETLKDRVGGDSTGVTDMYNYIIDVKHVCKIGESYDRCPTFIGLNARTPFKSFSNILDVLDGNSL